MRRLSTGDFTGRATMVMLGGCQKSSEQCTARRCRFVTGSKPGLGNVPLRKAAARPSRVRRQSGKQFVPENWLSNCVFKFCDDLVDRCYTTENKLIDQLWRLSQLDCAIGPMDSD